MEIKISKRRAAYKKRLGYSLLIYSLLSFGISLLYYIFNQKFVALNISQWVLGTWRGSYRIQGNELALHSPLLIGLLLFGALFSLLLLILGLKFYYLRSFMPILSLIAFLLPLFPPYDTSQVARLGLAYFLAIVGAFLTVKSLT